MLCLLPLVSGGCSDMGLPSTALSTGTLSPQESNLDCTQLSGVIQAEIARLKGLPTLAYTQKSQAPPTLQAAWSRMTGPDGADLPALRDYTHARGRLRAFSAQHAANCRPTIDVDAQLADTDRIMSSGAWTHGSAEEARAMLDRASTALKTNPAQSLPQIRGGAAGFRDRDLHVVCAKVADGTVVADAVTGTANVRDLKDAEGKDYGAEMLRVASEGSVAEVGYSVPPSAGDPPRARVLLVTRVADLACGVSHWR
jgi:hypothetical protein